MPQNTPPKPTADVDDAYVQSIIDRLPPISDAVAQRIADLLLAVRGPA